MSSFDYPTYAFVRSPDHESLEPVRHPVVIIGAGPVGLTAALDLADQGLPVVVLDDDDTVSYGSRAICWAKRTLEVWDRLGVADPMLEKGVTWNLGKVYFGADQVYAFNLQPEGGQKFPAFINLQQYHVEYELVTRADRVEGIDLRWKSKVIAISQDADGVLLHVDTPDGVYKLAADWVIAADGVRSPVRRMMGLDFEGRVFEDRFLIADVKMKAEFPTERRFWFQPPFHSGASALLHRQADDIWRIDLQLGWDAKPDEEKKPERVVPRLKEMLGDHPMCKVSTKIVSNGHVDPLHDVSMKPDALLLHCESSLGELQYLADAASANGLIIPFTNTIVSRRMVGSRTEYAAVSPGS